MHSGEWAVYVTAPKRGPVTDILASARTVSVNRPAVG